MRIVLFCHSLISDWNHGNAHFLRGLMSEMAARGIEAACYEPAEGWSAANLAADHGGQALERWQAWYPDLVATRYDPATLDLDQALDGADIVLVHEWNSPALVESIGRHRRHRGRYVLLFHDTHHRSLTEPATMAAYDLDGYDAVLAFGAVIRERYLRQGWARQAFTWHEAADARLFRPHPGSAPERDLVWIGNWGDEERTEELGEFLIEPAMALGLRARIHGVRYPADAIRALKAAGLDYAGYLPNFLVPLAFAAASLTIHVPRRPYAESLPGIPTIRIFEALACGIPLVTAPWDDAEGLFEPGEDYLVARDGTMMRAHLRMLLADPQARAALARRGRDTVLARHTCAHRLDELLTIASRLRRLVAAPLDGAAAG